MELIAAFSAVWLGFLFLLTGSMKLVRYPQAMAVVRGYQLLPDRAASSVGVLLPWTELASGLLVVFAVWYPVGAVAALTLSSIFAGGTIRLLTRNSEPPPCGCVGTQGTSVSWQGFARCLAMTGAAIMILVHPFTLPLNLAVGLVVVALLPAIAAAFGQMRQSWRMRQQVAAEQKELDRLRQVLSRPI